MISPYNLDSPERQLNIMEWWLLNIIEWFWQRIAFMAEMKDVAGINLKTIRLNKEFLPQGILYSIIVIQKFIMS